MRMNEKPLLSVIIPTHNRAKMLKRAIGSVLAQTWQDFEVIVVSDGSTDNTEEVGESFKDPRMHLLKHESARGASAARNTGLRVSNGKYIAFLDDDDEWTLNKLEVQLPVIQRSGPEVGLVYCWMDYVHEGQVLKTRCPTLRGYIFPEMLDKQAITNSSTLLIRREVLDIVKGFDETLPRGNDGDFIRRVTKHFEVDYVPKVLSKVYVGHADRISINSRKNLENVIVALEKRLQDFEEDFVRYPEQTANVHSKIGRTCFEIGQYRKGLAYYWKMLKSGARATYKMRLLYQTSQSIVMRLTRKALVFRKESPN